MREYFPKNTPNPQGNRASRRATYAQNRKCATIGLVKGIPQHGIRGALTGSNRSRPIKRYKKTWYTPDQYADVIGRWMVACLDKRVGGGV